MPAVHIDGLSFSRSRTVFDNLSAQFMPGKTLLLGPNGAGKTTLIEILATVLRPASGDVSLVSDGTSTSLQADLRRYRQLVAWMPQRFSPVRGLTVEEHVQYVAWLHGAKRSDARDRATVALERVELSALANSSVAALSGGQKQRLGLAGVLATDARVLLLDEPTVALDPASRDTFMRIIRGLQMSRTVIFSTHQTDDVATTFDHVAVLQSGEFRFQGSMQEFLMQGAPDSALATQNAHAEDISRAYAAVIRKEL